MSNKIATREAYGKALAELAKENENVIIFVVEEDKSVFPFKTRYKLIKEGTKDLKNVTVIPAGEYVISSATFPN